MSVVTTKTFCLAFFRTIGSPFLVGSSGIAVAATAFTVPWNPAQGSARALKSTRWPTSTFDTSCSSSWRHRLDLTNEFSFLEIVPDFLCEPRRHDRPGERARHAKPSVQQVEILSFFR